MHLHGSTRSQREKCIGRRSDVRYTYKRDTLVSMLEVSKDEMETLNLRALIDNDTRLNIDVRKRLNDEGKSAAMSRSERDAERQERHSAIVSAGRKSKH